MVTYINLSCYIRSVSAHTSQNNVMDKQATSITLSISSFDNESWWGINYMGSHMHVVVVASVNTL